MKTRTEELAGIPLRYAVALCEGGKDFRYKGSHTYWITIHGTDKDLSGGYDQSFIPDIRWADGGPIIEREKITLDYWPDRNCWQSVSATRDSFGPTPLVAAMRCYVASRLGDVVEMPDEFF